MTKVKVNPGRETLSELRRRKSLADEDLVIEGALPNIPGDEPNKLPKVLQGSERNVVFNNIVWPGSTTPNRNVRVQLAINGTKYGDVLNLRTPITYPQTLKLPADETRYERVFTLSYFVSYGSSSAPSEVENGRTQVYVDKSPPHHGTSGEAMKHPPEIQNGIINKSLLEAQEEFTFKVDLPTDKKVVTVLKCSTAAVFQGPLFERFLSVGSEIRRWNSSCTVVTSIATMKVQEFFIINGVTVLEMKGLFRILRIFKSRLTLFRKISRRCGYRKPMMDQSIILMPIPM